MEIPKALSVLESGVKLTPMMAQYLEVKRQFADTLVLFRMGDFYELFFEDAAKASQVLGIALTHRGKLGEVSIPMAGIPHHAAPSYLDRLTQAGLKAAICEQVEDPAEAKGIVKREVTQVIGPGLPYDVDKSDQREHHYIACVSHRSGQFFLAFLDYTTGDFWGTISLGEDELLDKLALYSPREFLCYLGQWENYPRVKQFIAERKFLTTHLGQDHFDQQVNARSMEKLLGNYQCDDIIMGQGPCALEALAALCFYICSTQRRENYHHIRPFRMEQEQGKLKISFSTLRGIEILPKSKETFKESLLGFFDRTKSAVGSRELKQMFLHPLACPQAISERQDWVQRFVDDESLLTQVREELTQVRDIERILVKLTREKIRAQDLLNLSQTIAAFERLVPKLAGLPPRVLEMIEQRKLRKLITLGQDIAATISDELGAGLDKGNLIRSGVSSERDRLKKLAMGAQKAIEKLEQKYRAEYAIGTLKIKHNGVLGHFIEISRGLAKKAPTLFCKKQTLVNCERFSSDELQKLEMGILTAQDRLQKLEHEILQLLLDRLCAAAPELLALSRTIGCLDALSTLAWVAFKEDLSRPVIHPDRQILQVKKGRHPLVEAHRQEVFIPHDITLDCERYFALITGPNMAGKTTVMREMAIIQFLAQVGSFVPAESAELGLCDYLFSRLGASDDIVGGQSTFMVEMSETASILRHATARSFIILDEVGRGTSTYDGMSIAWALVEFFVREVKALCLFSTHYHELIELVHGLPGSVNLTVETVTRKGEVKFLYRLIEGGAQESFGLYVAKLAGLPKQVLQRSQQILGQLEAQNAQGGEGQLSLLTEPAATVPQTPSQLESDISELNISEMTPLEALQKLHEWQSELHSSPEQ